MSDLSKTRMGQVQLDRLVDGELNPRDRREAISQLAQQPDGWRRCALAFLEAQSIRENLSLLTQSERASVNNCSTSATVSHQASTSKLAGRDNWISWLSMAACVLLAFTWGRYGMYPQGASAPSSPPSLDSMVAVPTQGAGEPVVSYHPDVDMFAGQSVMPSDIEQHLRDMGISVRRQHGLMPVMDERGNQLVVPYEDVNFVPVSQELR